MTVGEVKVGYRRMEFCTFFARMFSFLSVIERTALSVSTYSGCRFPLLNVKIESLGCCLVGEFLILHPCVHTKKKDFSS